MRKEKTRTKSVEDMQENGQGEGVRVSESHLLFIVIQPVILCIHFVRGFRFIIIFGYMQQVCE